MTKTITDEKAMNYDNKEEIKANIDRIIIEIEKTKQKIENEVRYKMYLEKEIKYLEDNKKEFKKMLE